MVPTPVRSLCWRPFARIDLSRSWYCFTKQYNTLRRTRRRMNQFNLCFLGFGNVGRALARLLAAKRGELRDLYGIDWRITGVATRRMGWLANQSGLDVVELLGNGPVMSPSLSGISEWLNTARPDVVFETT